MNLLLLFLLSLSDYKNLETNLLQNYSATNIPSQNGDTLNVQLGIAIRAINNIDQIEGTITSNIWLRYYWHDDFLCWNPESYSNISEIVLKTDPSVDEHIWTPDMYLYNTAEKPLENLGYTHAVVQHTGDVFWSRPGLITSTCVFNLDLFPFDTQNCYLKFGSWVYNKDKLNLTQFNVSMDFDNYQQHDGWEILSNRTEYTEQKYACCPDLYIDLKFHFTLRRKAGFYNINIIVPTFATAFLMLISLFIPWDSGERISFAVTVMLSIIVFLLILSDNLPKTDTIPLLSRMLIGLTIFSLVIVFFTVIITAVHSHKPSEDSYYIKFLNKLCQYNCRAQKAIRTTMYRSNSYLDVIETTEEDVINSENCKQYANKIENWFTIIFTASFIIYSSVVFSNIPS